MKSHHRQKKSNEQNKEGKLFKMTDECKNNAGEK